MHHTSRRVLRRPQRRRRLLIFVVAGLVFFLTLLYFVNTTTTVPADVRIRPTAPPSPSDTTRVWQKETQQTEPQQTEPQQTKPHRPEQGGAGGNDVERPTTAKPQEDRLEALRRHYAEDLDALDVLDLFSPRPGEAKVSFADFTDCLGNMLDVDAVTRKETPRTDPNNTEMLPLLISVTMGNTEDLKAMICNLSVPYKYVVLAQMGDTPEMTPFFTLLLRVFSFTKRLVVLQFKESIGFAGAVNAGLREALRHPFDEVPFVHLVHNDVRYVRSALRKSIRPTYLDFQRDKAVIAKLEEEVRTEPNTHTPLMRQPRGLRAPLPQEGPLPQQHPDARGTLVTSALLPDRVRYMPAAEREDAFATHISFMFHNSRGEYTAVYLSRLAILTVGFFDENFYPAMFEDTDFRWRAYMLGFTEELNSAFDGSLISFDLDCANAKVDGEEVGPPRPPRAPPLPGLETAKGTVAPQRPRLSPATRTLLRECATAFQRSVQFTYMAAKWGVSGFQELLQARPPQPPYAAEAFSGRRHLPLDAWAVDTARVTKLKTTLLDTGIGGMELVPYNPDVILAALA